jgi:signal transduction histidine kinase
MKKLTLQWRITLLTALVLALSTISLTAISIRNAEDSFIVILGASTLEPTTIGAPEKSADSAFKVPDMPATPAQAAKRQFDLRSMLACGLFTIGGTVAAYFAAGKALRPLRSLSDAVSSVDETTLAQRLPSAQADDEVGILTQRFNDMLTRLDDAFARQKRFTANAAHELKTLLAVLKTGIQVLAADSDATLEDYQEQANHALTSVNRLAGIVDDLLLLASAGASAPAQEEVLLDPLFDAIQNEFLSLLERRGMHCTIRCGDLFVAGNAALLYRAFTNLIENACKYGKQGGQIVIEAASTKDGVVITIADDGPGIDAAHLPYLFDAFYRVDKSRSRAMGGSGLGLSLVKTIIEAHGGSVAVQSDGISGTCFTVMLPNQSH